MSELLVAIVVGLIAGVLSPILVIRYQKWDRERSWAAPRKDLLRKKLRDAPGEGWVSIEVLSRLTGTSRDDCRTLLIDIDARGGTLKDGREGWAFISRRSLDGPASEEDSQKDASGTPS